MRERVDLDILGNLALQTCHFLSRSPEARTFVWGPWTSVLDVEWLEGHLGGGAVTQERGLGWGGAFGSREQLRGDGTDQGDLQTWCV